MTDETLPASDRHPNDPIASEPTPAPERGGIEAAVIAQLKTVYDPEIPVDIYELGLVYAVEVSDEGHVEIRMTLTSPMCPVAGSLPPEVEAKVAQVPGVQSSRVELVWEPPWNPSMMSEAARLELGFD
ncbi:MAG: SUF system Fe-S cluster assembly protein [Deltaproteobacteria bacterium]|nr:SUF system Fe-S cluster assembly protein [Deltaproteobacteria bacterium]